MLKAERQQKILNMIAKEGYVTVDQISKELYVSEPTARRDLNEMARQQLIIRSHGGATLRPEHNAEVPIDFRNTYHTKSKNKIAKVAASLVKEGDVIFIDASTTTLHILEHIKALNNVTVITNSIQATQYLRNSGLTVYSTGGIMLDNSLAYGGSIAEETLERFNIDLMFFSSYGISEDGMIQDYSEAETNLRIKAMRHSQKCVFLFDKSKLGKKSLFNVANVADIHFYITDAKLSSLFPLPREKRFIVI
ncbi:MAG: DeoR/GlpR transcriptional regulator [Clostridia bacterium]|nr:DeoR/GlpR transcriptional regulator [Clostridia bacterium]